MANDVPPWEREEPEPTGVAPWDVGESIKETLNAQAPEKSNLPGNQPRLVSPTDATRAQIARDVAISDALNTETLEQAATRRLEGAMAHSQDAVPFFPRIRGAVAAAGAMVQGKPAGDAFQRESELAAKQIAEAKAKAPETAWAGLPVMLAMPGGVAGKTAGARIGGSAALGGAYGAGAADAAALEQGRNPTAGELATGAAIGAGAGAGAGVAGEALRPVIRNASSREDKQFIREIVRTEAGEGANAMLARNKEGLVREYEDVINLRHDPEIRKAVRAPEGKGAEVLNKRLKPYAQENAILYSKLDDAAREVPKPRDVSGEVGMRGTVAKWNTDGENVERSVAKDKLKWPREPKKGTAAKWDADGNPIEVTRENPPPSPRPPQPEKRVGLMNASRLDYLLDQSKANLSPEAAVKMDGVKNDLNHFVKHTWNGETEMPASRFRHWLTSVQDSANRVPGSLNATKNYETTMEVQREATRIFNDYLDSIGAPEVVAKIRANNEKMTPMIRVRDAMEVKGKKEKLEHMGLGKVMEEQTRKLEWAAAAGSALSGHPEVAAAVVARPYVESGAKRSIRWLNANVLEPMEIAAKNGATLAELSRFAVERGIPQGTANAMAARTVQNNVRSNPPQPAPTPVANEPSGQAARAVLGGWKDGQATVGGRDVALLERLKEIQAQMRGGGATP